MAAAELGQVIHEIRQRRGILLKDLGGTVSVSTLSRVERGQASLSLADLSQVLQGLGTSVSEVVGQIDCVSPFLEVWQAFGRAAAHDDVACLDTILSSYQNRSDYVGRLVWLSAQGWKQRNFSARRMPELLGTELTGLLLKPESWYQFEYDIAGVAVCALPLAEVRRVVRRAAAEYTKDATARYEAPFLVLLYNVAYVAATNQDLALADMMLGVIRGIPTSRQTLFVKYRMTFLTLSLNAKFHPSPLLASQLTQLIATMKLIGASNFAAQDAEMLRTFQIKLPGVSD
ncbi:helix-turn-helix domain-containing protein [Lacticaseibacillus kribbianus]|uniref:helix-turn-helix domain-containing protein n=1 Tax=Lacticaseibacillus kribbianus TaxID=2926292 RepID=UPI001CD2258D|nr:helix-turn-helix transcriptional regulator [Lacticaseibacillus kribbianus]